LTWRTIGIIRVNVCKGIYDFWLNISFLYIVKIITYLFITRIFVHILIEAPLVIDIYISILFTGVSIEYLYKNKLRFRTFLLFITQNKTYFITQIVISRLFIIALFLSLIWLLTYINCSYINDYIIPYLSVSPLLFLIKTGIIAEHIHLTQEILGSTLNVNVSGGNNQNPIPGQNPGGGQNPTPGQNPGGGQNPGPDQNPVGGHDPESSKRKPAPLAVMPNVMNDGDALSPLEVAIKRRIYHKLINQDMERTGPVKKYALSTDFSPRATLNEDEREVFFKVIWTHESPFNVIDKIVRTPERHIEQFVVKGRPNTFSRNAVADNDLITLFRGN